MKQTKQSVGAAIDALSTGGSIRCNDMVRILSGLGFAVRDGSKQGHEVITHPKLEGFTSAAFACGHGRNPQVKPVYAARIRKLLESHADDLRKLKENQ